MRKITNEPYLALSRSPALFLSLMLSLACYFWCPVPGAPPRKLEVEAINSTAIRVTWKPPLQGKQHGQIRGYQVIFSRLENGEPRGQPNIMDVALPEAQVLDDVFFSVCLAISCSFPILVILHHTFIPFPSLSSHFISPLPCDTQGIFFDDCRPSPVFQRSLHATFDSKLALSSHSFGFWNKRSILILQ